MTGQILGAAAPGYSGAAASTSLPLVSAPASTRTRQLQGVCLSGALMLSVYSSRRASVDASEAVCIALHESGAERMRHMSATQARELARLIERASSDGGSLHRIAASLSVHGQAGEALARLPASRARSLVQALRAAANAADSRSTQEG